MIGDHVQIERLHRLVAPLGVRIAAAGRLQQSLDIAPVAQLDAAVRAQRDRLAEVGGSLDVRLAGRATCLLGGGGGHRIGENARDRDLTVEELDAIELARRGAGGHTARVGRAGAGRGRLGANDRTVGRIVVGDKRDRRARRRRCLGRADDALSGTEILIATACASAPASDVAVTARAVAVTIRTPRGRSQMRRRRST